MPTPRKELVHVNTTPYYHVIGRCVRRGFLCGVDTASGRNYEHRRQWIVERLGQLVDIFAVDCLAYAVMSNHYHVVLKLKPDSATSWISDEVLSRWERLYGLPLLLQRWRDGELGSAERTVADQLIAERRQRLQNLSWFMKCLNEPIARRANKEDFCTGAFWEGRFKSQALLDERALLACMAYVDLNPVRAKVARTPERSDYTSIQKRMNPKLARPVRLALFEDETAEDVTAIPYQLKDYIELVDWTGRCQRDDKRGAIPGELEPVLERIGFDEEAWWQALKCYREARFKMVGPRHHLIQRAEQLQRQWFKGAALMEAAFARA